MASTDATRLAPRRASRTYGSRRRRWRAVQLCHSAAAAWCMECSAASPALKKDTKPEWAVHTHKVGGWLSGWAAELVPWFSVCLSPAMDVVEIPSRGRRRELSSHRR